MLKISNHKRGFSLDGKPFFYLADTCWSAFTSIDKINFEEYLKKRASQGFNVLQINILPQWDRSIRKSERLPFETDENGKFNFEKINFHYFEYAREMCVLAKKYNFELSLVVLWANYVENTWASILEPKNIIPKELLKSYFEIVYATFDDLKPIYLISGDSEFDSDEAVFYFQEAFNYFSKKSPYTLKSLHLKGRVEEIPDKFDEQIDFYMYQSGHSASLTHKSYSMAEVFYTKRKKPIVNSEPCYEQMGYSREYGRFRQRDTREAAWWSVLSGANAGLSYGAHGIWSWHGVESSFSAEIGEQFDQPINWIDALSLPGAYDYGFVRFIIEQYELFDMVPCQNDILNETDKIRISKNAKNIIAYIPSKTNIILKGNFEKLKFYYVDLLKGRIMYPEVHYEESQTIIEQHDGLEDVLLIGRLDD